MIQLPFPSTIEAQPRNVTFLTKKPWSEKSRKTTVRRAHVLGHSGGGGGMCLEEHFAELLTSVRNQCPSGAKS